MTDDQLQQLLTDVQYLKDRQAILDVSCATPAATTVTTPS